MQSESVSARPASDSLIQRSSIRISKMDEPSVPAYGTRKSSRRLQQQQQQQQSLQEKEDVVESGTTCKEVADRTEISGEIVHVNNTHATIAQVVQSSSTGPVTTGKQQRKWEMWQTDDTRWFFEALNEHGKDFNSIHAHMIARLKKKGVNEDMIKNKEQIRCYFNRQWNKISSFLDLSESVFKGVDKTAQQLYGLINYGEIWKRFNFKNDFKIDSKFRSHLYDMIVQGYTFMKFGKGKNCKLKTPACKALKKLNHVDESNSDVHNLPKDILIELLPYTNLAFVKVQSFAHNPCLRIRCNPQKRLASLISFLEDRWTNKHRLNTLQELYISSNNLGNEILEQSTDFKLRLRPHQSFLKNLHNIKIVRLNQANAPSATDLSLSAYIQNSKNWSESNRKKRSLSALNANSVNSSKKVSREDFKSKDAKESQPDSIEKSNVSPFIETVRSLNLLSHIVSTMIEDGAQSNSIKNLPDCSDQSSKNADSANTKKDVILPTPPPNATIGEWLSANVNTESVSCGGELEKQFKKNQEQEEPNAQPVQEDINSSKNTSNTTKEEEESLYRTIEPGILRNGWTTENTDNLTIGELCLMLRCRNKLIFHYDWELNEGDNRTNDISSAHAVLSKLLVCASIALNAAQEEKADEESQLQKTSNSKNAKQSTGRKNKRFKNSDLPAQSPAENSTNQKPDLIISSVQKEINSVSTVTSDSSVPLLPKANTDFASASTKFAIPNSPAPRQNKHQQKNRIVDEALLQEAKEQLNYRFTSRRNSRKPMLKQQPFSVNMNAGKFLASDLRQLMVHEASGSNQPCSTQPTCSTSTVTITDEKLIENQISENFSSAESLKTDFINSQRLNNMNHKEKDNEITQIENLNTNTLSLPSSLCEESNELQNSTRSIDNDQLILLNPLNNQKDSSSPKATSPPSLSCLLDISLGDGGCSLFNDSSDKYFFNSLLCTSSSNKNTPLSTPTKAQIESAATSSMRPNVLNSGFEELSFSRMNDSFSQHLNNHISAFGDSSNILFSDTDRKLLQPASSSSFALDNPIISTSNISSTDCGVGNSWINNLHSDHMLNNIFTEEPIGDKQQLFSQKKKQSENEVHSEYSISQNTTAPESDSLTISSLMNESTVDMISKFVNFTESAE